VPLYVDPATPTRWATREQARNPKLWADAPSDDETLDLLLAVATEQCAAYAPAQAGTPSGVLGCIYQARELHAAAQRDGDVIGVGDYAIRSRPLTAHVKQTLRPQRGRPGVG
jgi:hypothetical protein